jgi:hypothetical protein
MGHRATRIFPAEAGNSVLVPRRSAAGYESVGQLQFPGRNDVDELAELFPDTGLILQDDSLKEVKKLILALATVFCRVPSANRIYECRVVHAVLR